MKFARLVVRLYPRRFRQRYGHDAVRAFASDWLESRGLLYRARISVDLFLNGLFEWLYELKRWYRRRRPGLGFVTGDLRVVLRSLRRSPGFALAAGLTIAIGIAATTTVFSVVYSALFQPPPFANPRGLVQIVDAGPASPANFVDLRNQVRTLDQLEATSPASLSVTGLGPAERVSAARVTGGLFGLLGRAPIQGRAFGQPDEIAVSGAREVVISHSYWRSRFGGSEVLGQAIELDGTSYTIVGVAPAGFDFPNGTRIWLPLRWSSSDLERTRSSRYLYLWGRLAPGMNTSQARDELLAVFNALVDRYPDANGSWRDRIGIQSMSQALAAGEDTGLLLVGGAVLLVMLVVIANVGNLTLARHQSRKREYAVRSALGAGRGRLLLMALQESGAVTLGGVVVGIPAAYWLVDGIVAVFGSYIPRASEVDVHAPVLAAVVVLAAIAALTIAVVGHFPFKSRDLGHDLREVSALRSSTGAFGRLWSALMAGEVALALMLLTGAGLLTRSFIRLLNRDLGFEASRVYAVSIALPRQDYADAEQYRVFFDELLGQVGGLPGVEAVGAISKLPFDATPSNVTRATSPDREGAEARFVEIRVAMPGLFRTLGAELLRGRDFVSSDIDEETYPAVINSRFSQTLFGGDDPVGSRIDLGLAKPARVVGVAADIREWGPHRELSPTIYLAFHSIPLNTMSLLLRTAGTPVPFADVRRTVQAMAADIPVDDLQRLSDRALATVGNRRFLMWLLLSFAAVATVLGAIGVYGVVGYSVSRRTREIGVRMALGASRSSVVHLTFVNGLKPALIGVAIGTLGAGALSQTLNAVLVNVSALDPVTYLLTALALVVVVGVAALIPSLAASSVDPVHVMRDE